MNDNYWQLIDLTGDNKLMGSMDLITEMAKAEGLRKESANKDNAMKLADELKRDPALFDSLANLDGNGESLSGWDVMFAHGALNLNDRMGKQVFTPEQITLLKNHNWDTLKELAKAQDLTKADLENVPKYEKHPWETEDSLESDNKEKAKLEAEAREEAVQEKAKLEAAKITGKKIVDATVELGAAVGEKLGAGLAAVGDMITDQLPPTDQISKYYIESGQGFDRIARDVLRREASRAKGSEVREFDEADVVALSSEIAKFNGMQRQDILRMDQESLNIPPINWAQISAS